MDSCAISVGRPSNLLIPPLLGRVERSLSRSFFLSFLVG